MGIMKRIQMEEAERERQEYLDANFSGEDFGGDQELEEAFWHAVEKDD